LNDYKNLKLEFNPNISSEHYLELVSASFFFFFRKREREDAAGAGVRATPTLPYMHLANPNFWQNMEKAPPTLPYMHLAK